ncbi:MAG TPA: hypothetical protein VHZ09_17925 [Acidobacteriaceae bacterium]|jgi:hypothetical protein|nr:hypothetical protein [Acidobacteriaceae bacterium]
MPQTDKDEIVFPPLPSAYRALSRRRRILLEFTAGLIVLILLGVAASLQMPGWLRLIGWALLVGYWALLAILVTRRWLRRRGWER